MKVKFFNVMGWLMSVLGFIFSLVFFASNVTSGFLMLIAAVIVNPVVSNKIEMFIKLKIDVFFKSIVFILAFVIAVNIGMKADALKLHNQEKEKVSIVNNKIESGNIEEAREMIEQLKKSKNQDIVNSINTINQNIKDSSSLSIAKKEIEDMTNEEFELLNAGELSKVYHNEKGLNDIFIKLLEENKDHREVFIQENLKIQEEKRITEEEERIRLESIRIEQEKIAEQQRIQEQERLRLTRIQEEKEKAAEKARKKADGVSIGMTKQDVLDSKWGSPTKINRTVTSYGIREQWVYRQYSRGYLYFEGDILTSIQN